MNFYLDEDLGSPLLARSLRAAGHVVQRPADVGLAGSPDPVVLTHAIRVGRVFLSRNYKDFERLHSLIKVARGDHPGILVVRRDNDPRRNMAPKDVVRAIRNLESAGAPVAGEYIVLNCTALRGQGDAGVMMCSHQVFQARHGTRSLNDQPWA